MLTDRQLQTYEFIRRYLRRCGYPPKLHEIAQHLGIRSRGSVHRYLRAIAGAGLITIVPERARGIRLREQGRKSARTGVLPLVGRIAAGRPIEAISGVEEISLNEFFAGPGRFVLRVQGDSMIEDGILPDDWVIIEKRESAYNGEIVVALIDDHEATLKRVQHNRDGTITLCPANRAMSPKHYGSERVCIQGVLIGQFRAYR